MRVRCAAIQGGERMMRWQVRFGRALVGLGAVLALVVGAGAGTRW
jgi:hypothetical protein